jgi:PleD family two-component response regulator
MLDVAIPQDRRALLASDPAARAHVTQKVVIVNDSAGVIEPLETVLEAGRYDVVFVESNQRAYSQVRRIQPDLVILCIRIDDLDAFQVLSMLKLDRETRDIPVLTYTTDQEGEDVGRDVPEVSENGMFASRPAELMN